LILLLVVTPGFLGAQDVLIKNARVFDGERVILRASVLVRDGKIEQIGPHIGAPKNVRVVDGRGKTLIPGLIDAHTHIHSRRDLEQSAVFGVTSDISMLMDLQLATAEKAEQTANRASDRADLFSSGFQWIGSRGVSASILLRRMALRSNQTGIVASNEPRSNISRIVAIRKL